MSDFYSKYRKIIGPIAHMYPPNFGPLEEALVNGLDINVFDEEAGYDMQDTLLSCIADWYGDEIKDDSYLPSIVSFFLSNGYDVKANAGLHGAMVLKGSVYPVECSQNWIEAVKLLLDAGADPFIPLYDDNDPVSTYEIATAHDSDNRGICDYDLRAADYHYALSVIFKRWKEGKDYHSIQHIDTIIGQTVRGVYADSVFETVTSDEGNVRQSLSRVCILLDDMILNAYGDESFIVESIANDIDFSTLKDCSYDAQSVIGHTIVKTKSEHIEIANWGCHCRTFFHIETDNCYTITFANDFLEGPYPQKWITYMEIKKESRNMQLN